MKISLRTKSASNILNNLTIRFFWPNAGFVHSADGFGVSTEPPGTLESLRWRHNVRNSVSNHQPHYCLLNRLFRRRSKKTSNSASLAFVWGIHRGLVNSPHQWPVTRKMFPFDDVIMIRHCQTINRRCTFYKVKYVLINIWKLMVSKICYHWSNYTMKYNRGGQKRCTGIYMFSYIGSIICSKICWLVLLQDIQRPSLLLWHISSVHSLSNIHIWLPRKMSVKICE